MPTFNIKDKKLAEEIAKSRAKVAEKAPETKTYTHSDVPRGSKNLIPQNPGQMKEHHIKTFDL